MLSFRTVFKNNNVKVNSEFKELDLAWYDKPLDDPYEFEYVDKENNKLVAWTEHLIQFHKWLLDYYSQGYSLYFFSISIYRDHDQTQDDILFSMAHYVKDYNKCIQLIKEALGGYTETSKEDLKYINYIELNSTLLNRIINFNKNLYIFINNNDINKDEIFQCNNDITSITELPYFLYNELNTMEKVETINSIISLLKKCLKYFSDYYSNNTKRTTDSTLLLINELTNIISISDDPFSNNIFNNNLKAN